MKNEFYKNLNFEWSVYSKVIYYSEILSKYLNLPIYLVQIIRKINNIYFHVSILILSRKWTYMH